MKKVLFLLYQPYKWLIFIPLAFIITFFWGMAAVLLSFFLKPKIVSYLIGVSWGRLLIYLTPVFVQIKGRKNIQKRQSYVIIANHLSQYDILLIYGWLGIDFKWVMKQELRKVPGLGPACERLEHIFIDRKNPLKSLETINQAKNRIKNGTSVIFFPEGTRSRNGEMQEFRRGAFKMAFDLNLPMLPVTIKGTDKILPTSSLKLFPGKVEMIIHPAINIENYTWNNVADLIAVTQQQIQKGLE